MIALRKIRSFVRREGRMTSGQRHALKTFWPHFSVETGSGLLNFDLIFGRRAPRMLEIGFGMGDALVTMASTQPENDYLGIEVYRPGIGSLINRLVEYNIENVRIISEDAVHVLEHNIPEQALDAVYLFFPDPWPKKRHHKRRIVQPAFIQLLASRIKQGGVLHMATDWEDYAVHMMSVMNQVEEFRSVEYGAEAAGIGVRPTSKFERRGLQSGHVIRDLCYICK